MPIPPRYQCTACEDWGTVIAPEGQKGTVPCPGVDPRTPCTAPKPQSNTPSQSR